MSRIKSLIICLCTLLILITTTFVVGQSNTQDGDKIKIVVTASMLADMAANIAGDLADVEAIVPIGGDPHVFDPTPSSARMAAGADIVFKNGLTFEGWLTELIKNSGTKAPLITVTEGVDAITSEQYQNATDPHAWMSARFGIIYAQNIMQALSSNWPKHKDDFEQNFEIYKKKLEELDQYIEQQIASIPESKRILITSHDAFQYYGRRYGIRLESILGVSTDADVQTSDIRRLTEVLKSTDVPAVFVESTINPKLLERIAKDNNVVIGGKLYADSLGDPEGDAGTYEGMLRYNTDVIVSALKKQRVVKDASESKDQSTDGPEKPLWMWIVGGLTILGLGALIIARRNSGI